MILHLWRRSWWCSVVYGCDLVAYFLRWFVCCCWLELFGLCLVGVVGLVDYGGLGVSVNSVVYDIL